MDITINSLSPEEKILHLYLPSTLDIEIIRQKFGKWWKSALVFVDYFCEIAHSRKSRYSYYANVSSVHLDLLVGRNYAKIIDIFCQMGIFTRNDTYSQGKFTKSYRISPEHYNSEFYSYDLEYAVGAKRRLKYIAKLKEKQSEKQDFIDDRSKQLKLEQYQININILNNKYEKPVNVNRIRRINDIMNNDELDNSKYFYNITDPKTGRIYTTVSGMQREARECLLYNGEKMVELDIKNCQPMLLATFYNKKDADHIKEREKYLNVIKNDDLYEFVNRRLTIPYRSRKTLKGKTYKHIFYGSLSSCSGEMWDIFEHHFPILAHIVSINKLNLGKNGFACDMQRKEADVVIDGLLYWVMKNRPDWGLIPIHDGVIVQQSIAEECQKEFLRIFKEKTGLDAIIGLK